MLKHLKAFIIACILFIIFLISLGLISNIVMSKIVTGKGVVVIPNFTDMSIVKAKELANQSSLSLEITDFVHHEYSEGSVISQTPSQGRSVYKNRTIEVTVSKGPKLVTIPMLTGFTYQNIEEVLRMYELKLGEVVQHYSNDVPAGYIINTIPGNGNQIMAGKEINIILSIGQDPLEIQDIQEMQNNNDIEDDFFEEDIF